MKKFIFTFALILLSAFALTGCTNQNKEKELITYTKEETEKIVSSMKTSGLLSQDSFSMYFLSFNRDLLLELEEQYNKGNKIVIRYEDGEYNNKTIGKDKNDTNKYYIYIGSENHSNLWTYGTIDLTTGQISWNDNY